jgi:hypothetical protein
MFRRECRTNVNLRPPFEPRKRAPFPILKPKRASERSWAAFHKFGAGAPHGRRYWPRYTTVAI